MNHHDPALETTLIAPRRSVRTYIDRQRGREVYADTGRPVDERLGSHIVLWIVDDAEAWAAKIEADADAAVARWPKDRIAKARRAQAYENAAQIRAQGRRRDWRSHYYGLEVARAAVAELYRSTPGDRDV